MLMILTSVVSVNKIWFVLNNQTFGSIISNTENDNDFDITSVRKCLPIRIWSVELFEFDLTFGFIELLSKMFG